MVDNRESRDVVNRRPLRVAIIGGGIGGLCLAHGLRSAGIDVTVYERTQVRDDWLQGYRIHINPAGSSALQSCLPGELWQEFVATAGQAGRRFRILHRTPRGTAVPAERAHHRRSR